MEATILGIPAIALSQDMNEEDHRDFGKNGMKNYSAAQCYAAKIIKKLTKVVWPKDVLINVNFPAARGVEVQGVEVTREGRNKLGDEIIVHKDPSDQPYYWIGGRQHVSGNPSGTDINAVDHNAISITPISMDMTHKPTIKILKGVFGSN